jgi:hypothetical protein
VQRWILPVAGLWGIPVGVWLGAVGWTTINNHFHPNLLLSLSAVVNSSLFFIKKRSNSTF